MNPLRYGITHGGPIMKRKNCWYIVGVPHSLVATPDLSMATQVIENVHPCGTAFVIGNYAYVKQGVLWLQLGANFVNEVGRNHRFLKFSRVREAITKTLNELNWSYGKGSFDSVDFNDFTVTLRIPITQSWSNKIVLSFRYNKGRVIYRGHCTTIGGGLTAKCLHCLFPTKRRVLFCGDCDKPEITNLYK